MIRTARILGLALLALFLVSGSSAQDFKVTLLGTGYPEPRMDRFGPSILVEAGKEKLLFDCGRGATQRLYQINVPFSEATALFLTHLHSDHTVGIPDFWLTGWIRGRKTPLRVWGPVGTIMMMKHLEEAFEFDVHIRRDVDEKLSPEGVKINATDIEDGVIYEKNGVKVTAFLVDHRPVKPAFGYRIDYAGLSVVLSGDTRYSENLINNAKGADVLIHEVMDPETFLSESRQLTTEQKKIIIEHHTTPEQAGRVFAAVKPQLAVFSHIVPGNAKNLVSKTRATYSGPLEVGEDLMTIDIGNKIEVQRPH